MCGVCGCVCVCVCVRVFLKLNFMCGIFRTGIFYFRDNAERFPLGHQSMNPSMIDVHNKLVAGVPVLRPGHRLFAVLVCITVRNNVTNCSPSLLPTATVKT